MAVGTTVDAEFDAAFDPGVAGDAAAGERLPKVAGDAAADEEPPEAPDEAS